MRDTPPAAQPATLTHAVLMCGGIGTRLRPWSYVIPKPLFPIGERPILELLLERLALHGVTEVFLSVHYVRETEPLGTAGALNLMRERLQQPFLMMNGDLVTHLDFRKLYAFHREQRALITVCAKDYDVHIPYGVVEDEAGRVVQLREKPTHRMYINAGIYVIDPAALALLPPAGRYDATQLIQAALDANHVVGSYRITDYWLDIGRIEDYERANQDARRWLNEDVPPPQV
jgi:NDP-sugar pyrophosphorylase family protein